MSRYIDADKLYDAVEMMDSVEGDECVVFRSDVIQTIMNAETADVEPVRHGKWKCQRWSEDAIGCEFCGNIFSEFKLRFWDKHTDLYELAKYCPICGAKMDGKENEQ